MSSSIEHIWFSKLFWMVTKCMIRPWAWWSRYVFFFKFELLYCSNVFLTTDWFHCLLVPRDVSWFCFGFNTLSSSESSPQRVSWQKQRDHWLYKHFSVKNECLVLLKTCSIMSSLLSLGGSLLLILMHTCALETYLSRGYLPCKKFGRYGYF